MADITDAGQRLRQMNDALERDEDLRLTDAEREAVEWCIFQQATPQRLAATLRGLLDRLG